jgi:hypothetical protein
MPQDQQMHFQAHPQLDEILIDLDYATRDLLGNPETFQTLEANGSLDEVLKDRGIEPNMIVEARKLQAILLGKVKVPEEGFVFGTLNGKGQLLMAVASCDSPGFALIAVMSSRPMAFGSFLTAAEVAANVRIQASADDENDPLGQVILAQVSLPHVPTDLDLPEHHVDFSGRLLRPGDPAVDAMLADMQVEGRQPN